MIGGGAAHGWLRGLGAELVGEAGGVDGVGGGDGGGRVGEAGGADGVGGGEGGGVGRARGSWRGGGSIGGLGVRCLGRRGVGGRNAEAILEIGFWMDGLVFVFFGVGIDVGWV